MGSPFVVAPPGGARVRTRLRADTDDDAVLRALGEHLGALASEDLMARCRERRLDAKGRAGSRRLRKRALTKESSSRWAGAITRTSEDGYQLSYRNLVAHRSSLRRRVRTIERRLALPIGKGRGRARGYATGAEHFAKRRRLNALEHRLGEVERRVDEGRVSVCRGGRALARTRHHLEEATMTEAQ